MIQYLKHKEINKSQWDRGIENSVNRLVYATSTYLDLVSPNWDALVNDDYSQLLPITWRKKSGLYYVCQPPLTQQLGLFADTSEKLQQIDEFLDSIPKKFCLTEFSLNYQNFPRNQNNSLTLANNFVIRLDRTYQTIISDYSDNLRRNLVKARAHNLIVRENGMADLIVDSFAGNNPAAKFFSKKDLVEIKRILNILLDSGLAEICTVFSSEEFLAGAVFLKSFDRRIFLFSGLTPKGKQLHAMPMLIDYFIQTHAATALVLDFEGSDNPSLARFYLGFGSKNQPYFRYRYNRFPSLVHPVLDMIKRKKMR